jgi:RNA polymerase sigma-70 factor (ECF subfamily)
MTPTPASLLERLTKGADPGSWGRFVQLYTPMLMRWCARLGLSESDAADFSQEVFVRLVERLPQFRYDANLSFRAWLKTVLMNVWRKHHQKAARAPLTVAGEKPELVPDTDPCQFVDEAEYNDMLIRRILAIAESDFEPTTWKACWELVVNDRPASDVAAELSISVNAVYLAKSRVLRHLRTELAGLLG